ncbi:hypothetical protein VHEMI09441 [[Torrubiella] hemipterigena]|uniref:Mitochondrial carrier protein n=1 Tax=[Torrubiella] hemipterigena TaxID=1531966 RepID=A0A0A1TQ11_9HYPO|nr:hypothetical protein VHEMI09441 [[Torrubiella] hemipterigena]
MVPGYISWAEGKQHCFNSDSLWICQITFTARTGGLAASLFTTLDLKVSQYRSAVFNSYFKAAYANDVHLLGPTTSSTIRNTPLTYFKRASSSLKARFANGLTTLAPSTALSFFIYGTCKTYGAQILKMDENAAMIHAQAALLAGFVTPAVMSSMQVYKKQFRSAYTHLKNPSKIPRLKLMPVRLLISNALACRGLWQNSYPGAAKLVIHMTLYERFKATWLRRLEDDHCQDYNTMRAIRSYMGIGAAAGCAQTAAVMLSHPLYISQAVLKQSSLQLGLPTYWMPNSSPLPARVIHCYGYHCHSLLLHLITSVPGAIVMFGVYELIIKI